MGLDRGIIHGRAGRWKRERSAKTGGSENRVYEKMDVVDYLTEAYKPRMPCAALRKI